MPTVPQPSLSGGELSSSLHGRVDIDRYRTSLKTCLNFVPQVYGGVKNRAGSRYVTSTYASGTMSRLVPFTFNADQSYVIELSGGSVDPSSDPSTWNGKARLISYGRPVLYGADEVARQATLGVTVTLGTPVTFNVPWNVTDLRELKFSQSGDLLTITHPDYEPWQIVRRSNDWWEIRALPRKDGPWLPINSEKGKTISADGSTGTVKLYTNTPNLFAGKVGTMLKLYQKDFGQPWEVDVSVKLGDIRRSDGKYYKVAAFDSGGAGPENTGTLRPSHYSDKWSDGKVVWEYLHQGSGWCTIKSLPSTTTAIAEVGADSRLPDAVTGGTSTVGQYYFVDTIQRSGLRNSTDTYYLTRLNFTSSINIPNGSDVEVTITYYDDAGARKSYSDPEARVMGVSTTHIDIDVDWALFSPTRTSVVIYDAVVSITLITSDGTASTYKWAFGAWGGGQGYPSCSAYFQQRHCFAGTTGQPQTVWMSKTGDFGDFGETNPLQDDDAITFSLASARIDGIVSMLPLDKLAMFTSGGNWVTATGQADTLSPSNLGVKLQNYYGASGLAPLGIGNTALYHGKSGTVRDMSYDYLNDSYTGNDLTLMASHLFQDTSIVEWDFQQSPFPIGWLVRSDGVLLGVTYLREEKVMGWHRHTLSGTVESVCVINECNEDHVYVVVKRTINGSTQRHIDCIYGRVDDEYEACFVDGASTYDGRNPGGTVTITGTFTPGGTVTVTSSTDIFVSGAGDEGDQIVLEESSGTQHRLTLAVGGYTSTKIRTATVGAVALPAALQSTALSTWAFARDTFSSLTHLANTAVSVYSEGTYASGTVSAGGVLTLASCSPALGPSFICTVGLPITAVLEPLNITVPGQQGPLIDSRKMINNVRLLVENSRSCYVGPTSSNLYESAVKTPADTFTSSTHASGFIDVSIPSTWNTNGVFYLKHTKPYPLSILALVPDLKVGT